MQIQKKKSCKVNGFEKKILYEKNAKKTPFMQSKKKMLAHQKVPKKNNALEQNDLPPPLPSLQPPLF